MNRRNNRSLEIEIMKNARAARYLETAKLMKAAVAGDIDAQDILRKAKMKEDEDAKAKAKLHAYAHESGRLHDCSDYEGEDSDQKEDELEDSDEASRDEEDARDEEDQDSRARTRTRTRSRAKAAKADEDEDSDEDSRDDSDEDEDSRDSDENEDADSKLDEYAREYADAYMRAREEAKTRVRSKAAADDFNSWASSPRTTPSRLRGNPTGEPGRTGDGDLGLVDANGPGFDQNRQGGSYAASPRVALAQAGYAPNQVDAFQQWMKQGMPSGDTQWKAQAGVSDQTLTNMYRLVMAKAVPVGSPTVPSLGSTVHAPDGQASTFDPVVRPL